MLLPEQFRRSAPWRLGDFFTAYACAVGGLLVIGLAWLGASSSVRVDSQVRWADLGVVGLVALGAGNIAWILTGRRAVGELRRHVIATVGLRKSAVAAPVEAMADGVVVSGPGMSLYHRPDCLFVAGKRVQRASAPAFQRRGRRPCRACLPTA
jgi:hypothetical protein